MHASWIIRIAVVPSLALWLSGCASVQQTVGGWFGAATPTPTPQPQAAGASTEAARTYYAGVAGLKVYGDAAATSKVVGQLALHEKVTRYKLERGYAYVESASGLKGWVSNAQLIWRLPKSSASGTPVPDKAPAAEAAPSAPEEAAPPPAAEPPAPAAEEATVAEPPPTPTATVVPAASRRSKPAADGPAPSIFDAY